MSRNTYFDNRRQTEQNLYEDCIIECSNIYGENMFYIPRTLVAVDDIIGEDRISQFKEAYKIVAYFSNVTQFDGQFMMSKFGFSAEQSATLEIPRKEWRNLVGRYGETIIPTRPCEGDLIYFPLTKGLFEIKFVQHQDPFYQLGKLYTWKLSVELFQYSSEKIDTGVAAIDIFETLKTFSTDLAVNNTGQVISVNLTNTGSNYTTPPVITFVSDSGIDATATAIIGTGILNGQIILIDVTNGGSGYSTSPQVIITGDGSNATAEAIIDINIDTPDNFGDNNKFKKKSKQIIFSETNPFGNL